MNSFTDTFSFSAALANTSPKLLANTQLYQLPQGPNNLALNGGLQVAPTTVPELNPANISPVVSETAVVKLDVQQETNEFGFIQQEEKTLERNVITPAERTANPEWFIEGKPAKTPAKYLLIRNFILDYWHEHKPQYASKSFLRTRMANCGDVNSFGRVHSFLESNGYINVNCPNNGRQVRKANKPRVRRTPSENSSRDYMAKNSNRKRKPSHFQDTWMVPLGTKSRRRRERPKYADNGDQTGENDPYQLVHLEDYTEDYPAPFKVQVKSEALVTVEFHSRLVLTEIIGLLGGTFQMNENGQKILSVEYAFPCKSTSTDIQCEMDPQSEMEAREYFDGRGMTVVGWYHSHPTFVAIPSIRDIENQMSYQDLFKIKETGDEPFIGLIVNPYGQNQVESNMTYVHISEKVDISQSYRLPYTCDTVVIPSAVDTVATLPILKKLVDEYKDHQEKVDMSSKVDGKLLVDLCVASIERFLHLTAEQIDNFVNQIRYLVNTEFLQLHQD